MTSYWLQDINPWFLLVLTSATFLCWYCSRAINKHQKWLYTVTVHSNDGNELAARAVIICTMYKIAQEMNSSYCKALINWFSESQVFQCLENRVLTTNTTQYLKKEIRKLSTCLDLVNRMNMGQKHSINIFRWFSYI